MNKHFLIFREHPETVVAEDGKEELFMTGRGLVIYRKDRDRNVSYLLDGEVFEPQLGDCRVIGVDGNSMRQMAVVGTDISGLPWTLKLSDDITHKARGDVWDWGGNKFAFMTRQQTVDLFRGRPFHEIVAELERSAVERELVSLRERAARAEALWNAMVRIHAQNTAGGSGSRKAVTGIIERVCPEIVGEAA